MVFVSKLLFEQGTNVVRCLDCDEKSEKIAIVDTQNSIILFSVSSFHIYFQKYRSRFQETQQYSHSNLETPQKISEIHESQTSLIIQLRFSSTKFLTKIEILNKEDESKEKEEEILQKIQTKTGKFIKLMSIQNQKKPTMKTVSSHFLASALENGCIHVYSLAKIQVCQQSLDIPQSETNLEIWTRQFKLINEDSLSIIDFKWSEDSKNIFALYYSQEIWIWGLNYENENTTPQKIHKINFNNYQIKTLCAAKSSNIFFAISNENIFSVSFSQEKIETHQLLENRKPDIIKKSLAKVEENEESKEKEKSLSDFLFFESGCFISCLNVKGNYLLVPYHEPNSIKPFNFESKGFYSYGLSEEKDRLIQMSLIKEDIKISCCACSNFFYTFYTKKIDFKISQKDIYCVFATLVENQIYIWKLKEFPKKKVKPILSHKIVDFKFILNYCLWMDAYTLLVNDENGRMWYVKFNCVELGFVLSKKPET